MEMLGINSWIIKHEIKTCNGSKSVYYKLQLINPKKATSIKEEVEKLLCTSFICLVPFTEWDYNPILIAKKQDNI